MQLIPSIDLLDGRVVRLTHGDFATPKFYGEPEAVLDTLDVPHGARLHVVDLAASREGRPIETEIVRRLARRDLVVQVGGGIRSLDDARRWLDCGAERLVVGTVAANAPSLLASLVDTFGAERIVPAVDVRDGVVRVDGWERASATSIEDVFARIESLNIAEALVTDISKDGALRGPSFSLYRDLRAMTRVKLIASGGVSTASDIVSLGRLGNVSGCVIGKALLEGRIRLSDVPTSNTIPERVIPCLDVRGGRVVKGVSFTNIRDAGDPVECAVRYEAEGADELVILDIDGGTDRETIRKVAAAIFIPLTVGGGIRTIDDFRAMLRAGADRVAINTAAVRRPELIRECSEEFGVQAVVLSCDATGAPAASRPVLRRPAGPASGRWTGRPAAGAPHARLPHARLPHAGAPHAGAPHAGAPQWLATVASGKDVTDIDAVEWCKRAEELGAGEILLTSVDRDGTNSGFDIELLRAVTSVVKIGVIASGGAGKLDDFRDAIEAGGARAVLAASLFHDRVLSVRDVKRHLEAEGIPVR